MNRTLSLYENGVEVKTYRSVHNDQQDSGLTEDFENFIKEVKAKKQVEIYLNPDAREIGRHIGQDMRKALSSNSDKSYTVGNKIGKYIGNVIPGRS